MRTSGVFSPPPIAHLQAGDIVAIAGRAGEHRRGHDRREPRGVELVVRDRGKRRLRLEIALDADEAAMPEHGDAGQVERADVIERADDEQSRLGAQARARCVWSADFQ